MPICRLSTPARNASANAVASLVDAAAGPGTLKLYTGTVPADGDTQPSGTLLATVTFADPAFGAASGGTVSATDPAAIVAVASGTATVGLIEDSAGANVMVVDVSNDAGTGTIKLATNVFSEGLTVDLSGFTYTQPAGA